MKTYTNCPRCQNDFGSDAFKTGSAICKCGWFDDGSSGVQQKKTEKKAVIILAAATVLLSLGYGHLMNWGGYAMSIPFVKIQEITGTLSNAGYEELAQQCIVLNKWSCAEKAYLELYTSRNDLEALAKLGSLEARLDKPEQALEFYVIYASKGGKDNRALLNYGTLLENAGKTSEAFKVFESSIAAHPEVLPVQATTAIVRMLIKDGKTDEAKARIEAFHKSAGNANGYLNTELTELTSKTAKRPKT
jgi:tetratricopeptide (TPR) repeat protein